MAGEARRRRMRALLDLADVSGDSIDAVEQAFVHESAAKESGARSNERLEFLGDSVLGMIVASWLYTTYPRDSEGTLTTRKARLVNDPALAHTAQRVGFSDLLELGAGMRRAGGAENVSILADAFEAFVAALYVSFGLETARRFVEREHIAHADHDTQTLLDPKTRLQHLAQEQWTATPVYHDEAAGTPQQPAFTSVVTVDGKRLGTGSGPSKKAAQREAAEQALATLRATK